LECSSHFETLFPQSITWIIIMVRSMRFRGGLLPLIPLFLSALLFHLYLLLKDPLIPGVDGPYYLIQVESILKGLGMVYSDPPLLFHLSAFTSLFLGDVRLGISLTVALIVSLSTVPTYLLFLELSGDPVPSSAASIALIFSPQLARMAGDLMKNAAGITFLMFYIYFMFRAFKYRRLREILLSILSAYLTFLTHFLDLAFLFLFMFSYLLIILIAGRNCWRKNLKCWILIALPVILLVTITSLLFPYYFSDMNKGFTFIKDVFSPSNNPSNPTPPFRQKPGRTWPLIGLIDLASILPYIFGALILFIYHVHLGVDVEGSTPILFGVLAAGFIGIFPSLLDLRSWAWRFLLMECIPIALFIGILLMRFRDKVTSILVALILLLPIILQGFHSLLMVRPTIQLSTYRDLQKISTIIDGSNFKLLIHLDRYWIEYLLGYSSKGLPEYLITGYNHPFLPSNWRLIFKGETLLLYCRSPI